jgi:hypothetical protein
MAAPLAQGFPRFTATLLADRLAAAQGGRFPQRFPGRAVLARAVANKME